MFQKSSEKQTIPSLGGAEPGAFSTEFQEIVTAWPRLSATVQAIIVSIIRTSAS